MKKQAIIITILFLSAITAWAQNTGEVPVPLSDPAKRGNLNAHINSGTITVRGTARKDVLVKYTGDKSEENRNENRNDNRDGLRKISSGTMDLEISENSNTVKVSSGSWSNNLNLDIEVPTGFDLRVSTYNDGDLVIDNVQGELELTNYNGEITATNISGSVVATTYNGEIKATFNKVTDNAPMSFSTFNGDVDLTLPATVKASLKMRTDQGEILTGFDVNIIKSTPNIAKPTTGGFKVKIDEWVKADINGGGPEFSMKTYNGDIKVKKK